MKRIVILVSCLLLIHCTFSQNPCYSVFFTSQSQIDSFPIIHPECTELGGMNVITGDDIVNLEGLSIVTHAEGLIIENCTNLTSLSGLQNLQWVGTLTQLYEGLSILSNPKLSNLNGLENLTTIEGALQIWDNDSLKTLNGLENLGSIGDGLFIGGNSTLKSLAGLTNLSTVGMDGITIRDNSQLTSLAGLENIDGASVEYLKIQWNEALSFCHVQSICDYLVAPNGQTLIYDNATGCSSVEEVEEACGLVGLEDLTLNRTVSIRPNPVKNGIATITLDNPVVHRMVCYSALGQKVHLQEITHAVTIIHVATWPPGIYLLVIFEDGKPVGRARFVVSR